MASGGMDVAYDNDVLLALIESLGPDVDDWLNGVAHKIEADVKLSFGDSPDGQSYTRRGITHVASVAGYPPNVDLGNLRASIHVTRSSYLHYKISDGVLYGIYLEDGTENIAPRPFINPAIMRMKDQIADDLIAKGIIK